MGIIKIRCRMPEMSIHFKQSSAFTTFEFNHEERTISGSYSGDDSDTYDLTEAGCEFCMVGDQLCCIPYELYDLPDLKEILSLETWNSCLTEQERFTLSAYLPDMDQHMFSVTMKELLGGKNIFFGSPLTRLFERLKGGLYPPKVARFREGLQFLQRRAFYHSVRSYHENLTRTFSDMKRAWRKCRPSIGVEERVCIWHMWKNPKGKDKVDLNTFPAEDSSTDDNEIITGPVAKKMKIPPIVNGISLVHPNSKAKGVLKIKPGGLNSMQNGKVCRPPPKGVLKIIPKRPLAQLQQPSTMSTGQEVMALMDISRLPQSMRRSPLPQSTVQWDSESYHQDTPFLHQPVRSRKKSISSELPHCTVDQLKLKYSNSTTEPSEKLKSSLKMIRVAKDSMFDAVTEVEEHNMFPKKSQSLRRYSCQNIEIGNRLTGQNVWQNSSPQNIDYYHHDSREREIKLLDEKQIPIYPRTTEVVSGISDFGMGGHQMLPQASLDQSTGMHRGINNSGLEKPYDKSAASMAGLQDGAMPPITYKRRKTQIKADPFGFVRPLTGVDFDSRNLNETSHHVGENVKAIKIKFKKQTDQTPLYKHGVLNWLHDSPSA